MSELHQSLAAQLESLERQLLTPAIRPNAEALLAEEFTEFGSSGRVYSRSEIVASLAGEASAPPEVELNDFRLQPLSPELALATYRTLCASPHVEALRSSLWVFRDARWQMLFHQGTPIPSPAL